MSSYVAENNQICGLFLVHEDDDGVFWADYLYAAGKESKSRLLMMLQRSSALFIRNYPRETEVVIHISNPEARALLSGLFPNRV